MFYCVSAAKPLHNTLTWSLSIPFYIHSPPKSDVILSSLNDAADDISFRPPSDEPEQPDLNSLIKGKALYVNAALLGLFSSLLLRQFNNRVMTVWKLLLKPRHKVTETKQTEPGSSVYLKSMLRRTFQKPLCLVYPEIIPLGDSFICLFHHFSYFRLCFAPSRAFLGISN